MPGQVGIPGVAVQHLGALHPGHHRQVDRHRAQGRGLRLWLPEVTPGGVREHSRLVARATPAVDAEVHTGTKLTREMLHVHTRPTVDLGRVLAREERDPHRLSVHTAWPLPMATIPPFDTW